MPLNQCLQAQGGGYLENLCSASSAPTGSKRNLKMTKSVARQIAALRK